MRYIQHIFILGLVLLAVFLVGRGIDMERKPAPTGQERVQRQQALCPGRVVTDPGAGDCLGTPKEGDNGTVYMVLGVLVGLTALVVWKFLDDRRYRPLIQPNHPIFRR